MQQVITPISSKLHIFHGSLFVYAYKNYKSQVWCGLQQFIQDISTVSQPFMSLKNTDFQHSNEGKPSSMTSQTLLLGDVTMVTLLWLLQYGQD